MFNLENSIKKWLRSFRKHRAFDHGSVREMELHLRDHIDDLIAEGHEEEESFQLAVKEFGEIPNMAEEEFWNQKSKPTFMSTIRTTMLKNYYKTSFRSLMKNPLTSFINIFGLSVAVGICLVVYAFIDYDNSIDQFHENKNEVYLATFFANRDGVEKQYGMTPRPLGEMLKEDFAYIKKMCRVEDGNAVLKYEDHVFNERIRYVDPEFLEMFTFPLKWGTSKSLADKNSIIFSEKMCFKYFGDENPIGRDIVMILENGRSQSFTIAGVAKAFPKAHVIDFNFLVNFENLKVSNLNYDLTDWREFVNATLIQVEKPSDILLMEQGMEKYRVLQNEVQNDWAISSFALEQLTTLYENAGHIKGGISYDGNFEGRIGLPIIALFMLALACFNYINIAIVSAAKRLKEIGVRKAIGANRRKVIVQFLTENVFITSFALILGVFLGALIFVPWFVQFTGWPLEIRPLDLNLWGFLLALLFLTGILSGMYPALYISKFDTVQILKGSMQFGKKNPMTKIFLGVQLVLALMTITAGVVFTQNNSYQTSKSWGYNQEGLLYARAADQLSFEQLKTVMNQEPNILSLSGSVEHLGRSRSLAVIHIPPNSQYEVRRLSVGANYFETMELALVEGRVFREDSENDKQAIVVNELLVKNMELDHPIGEQVEIDSIKYEIVGVLNDFHADNFFAKVQPTIFKLADKHEYRYLSMRVRKGTDKVTYEALQANWLKLFPEIPFQGGYQEDTWGSYFESVNKSEQFNKIIASMAVLLASLGLYGLVTLNVSGRVREFSIRKTLGAGVKNITSIIIKQYILLTVLALVIGTPISYVFAEAYLNMLFAYPMPMGYSGIAISALILIGVLLAVVSTQIRKVSKSNPVDGLKVE